MKSALRSAVAMVLLVALLSSCKNNAPKQAKLIPKTASVVLVLDAQAMQDKLQKGGISIDTLLERFFKADQSDSAHKAEMKDLRANAGINWNSQFYFFVTTKADAAPKQMSGTFSFIGSLSDAAKFESFLKKQDDLKNKEIKKESGYSYLLAEGNTMLSWTEQYVMVSIYNRHTKPMFDSVTMTYQSPKTVDATEELKKEVAGYYTQKENESMAGVDLFVKMFKEKGDGYAFTNSNSYLSSLSMLPLQLPKLEEFVKDNYSASVLTFEDGKIIAKSTSYPNNLVSGVLKQYPSPGVQLSMIEHYPSEHINGLMLFSFNPEIIGGLLKQLEIEGMANNFLQKAGMSSQDIYKALKGDMAVIVSDLGMKQPEPQFKTDELNMMRSKPVYKMIVSIPVGDKNSFFKLMDKAAAQGFLVKNNNVYKGGALMSMFGLYLQADEKNCVLASDSLTYVQYMSNTGKATIQSEILNRFKNKTGVIYFDIANTLSALAKNDSTGSYHKSMQTTRETFKDIIVTSDKFDGKSTQGVFEVRMQNEKQNSLVTLTSLLTDIAVDMRAQAKKERELDLFPGGVPAIIRTN